MARRLDDDPAVVEVWHRCDVLDSSAILVVGIAELFTCRRDGVFQLVLVDSPPIGPNRLQELLNRQIEASGLGFAPRLTERHAAEARQVVL